MQRHSRCVAACCAECAVYSWYSVGAGSMLHFVRATAQAPWAARIWHQAAIVQDATRIVVTGGTSSLYGGPQYFNDVWIGDVGGFAWSPLTSAASFSSRAYFGMASVNDQLFVFAGRNSSISVYPAAVQTGDFDDRHPTHAHSHTPPTS